MQNSTNKFWLTFPRKVGTPEKIICRTKEEYVELYNRYVGRANKVYVGIYGCDTEGQQQLVTLNVVAFDIDWDGKYHTMLELHKKLLGLDWKHSIMFSTNGFWIYVHCIPRTYDINTAKAKLTAMQDMILEDTGAFFGNAKEAPLDVAIRGDVERITRMPGSYDKKRHRWVIFLDEHDLQLGMDHIIAESTNGKARRFDMPSFGNQIVLDPETFDGRPRYNNLYYDMEMEESPVVIPLDVVGSQRKIMEMMPEFMRGWLLDPSKGTWAARSYLTLFFREQGFPQKTTEEFLKPFLEKMPRTDDLKNNWEQYKQVKTGDMIYKRMDLKFPSYKTLVTLGLCPMEIALKEGMYNSPAYRKRGGVNA